MGVKREHIPLVAALSQASLFRGLPLRALQRLAEQGHPNRFDEGSHLMRQGDASESLHVILRGRVRVERVLPGNDEPLVLAEFGPGEIVGEMGVLESAPRSATVTAIHDTETLGLTAPLLAVTLAENPSVAGALMRLLSRRIRRTDDLTEQIALGEVTAETGPADDDDAGARGELALQTVSAEFIDNLKAAIRAE